MPTDDKTGGPAFPNSVQPDFRWAEPGMTLRDWFAGQALAGMMADPTLTGTKESTARYCFECADAMLAERSKTDD